VFIGEGNETLRQEGLEVIRGSSSTVDQRVTLEDETGRAVVSVSQTGVVTLGDFDSVINRFRVRNYPIVSGDGTGTATTDRTKVEVEINGERIVVTAVDGTNGIVEIAGEPGPDDLVRCTYFFNRTDTLTTDDVSEQVTPENAYIDGQEGIFDVDSQSPTVPPEVLTFIADTVSSEGVIIVQGNNRLALTVDGVVHEIVIPPNNYTMQQVAAVITAAQAETLVASTFVNNFGQSAIRLVSEQSLLIGSGSANAPLSLVGGEQTNRTRTFYVFQGPMVIGDNGGVTTTDPASVVVKVNGQQVIPTSVDGQNRAVTLSFAPKAGATVTIQYWFNTWQDTFDYLDNINITDIIRVGDVPETAVYFDGADFILKNDLIVWGTATTTTTGVTTIGSDRFGDSQITTTLVDNRTFLSECSAVVDTTTGISVDSRTQFQLPYQPTLGNGRDTPLGQDLFQTVSNNRIDLPTNRPDVVKAYWGFDVQDALLRGEVEVLKVEGSVITLANSIDAGANVYATFWFNMLVDQEYTATVVTPGVSGTGTYQLTNEAGDFVLAPQFDLASKGAGLLGIPVNWPSGSELLPDLHFESVSGNQFTGPVQETVTVQFASREPTPAKTSAPGAGDYATVANESDHFRVKVDGSDLITGPTGVDLENPTGFTAPSGFFASLVGDEIEYTGGTGATVNQDYTLDSAEEMNMKIDGVQMRVSIDTATAVTVQHFADKINEVASGHGGTDGVATDGAALVELDPLTRSNQNDFYAGWVIVMGTGGLASGKWQTISSYNGTTGVATVADGTWGGAPTPAVGGGEVYFIYDPDNMAQMVGATRFDSSAEIVAGEYDTLNFHYTGDVSLLSGPLSAVIPPTTYPTAAALGTALETVMNAAIGGLGPAWDGLQVSVTSNASGQLVFKVQLPGQDTVGYLEMLDGPSLGQDFAVLAGLSTDAATVGVQAKLLQGKVAKRYTPTTAATQLLHDRLVMRNRLLPGARTASISPLHFMGTQELVMQSGNGNTKTGMDTGYFGLGGHRGVVEPASLLGVSGFGIGQIPTLTYTDARDGQPAVKFFDGTGINSDNRVFEFTIDGQPISVQFTGAPDGQLTPVGPIGAAFPDTVIEQIIAAMAALPGQPFGDAVNIRGLGIIRQEGAGIRISSTLSTVTSAVIIGAGAANGAVGFSEGQTSQRTLVEPKLLASALNAHRNAVEATFLHDFTATSANYFADKALAWVQTDATGNEYLYLQSNSLGATSSLEWKDATVGSVVTQSVLFPGTGLGAFDGEGAVGEAALEGFFVISTNPSGSGSIDTSGLNNGTGQDGIVGQTYRDLVTGLTFTILPRDFQDNPSGPWIPYPTGGTATFRLVVSKTITADANIPHNGLPGLEMTVANTANITPGDTAVVETFERGGNEPAVGDIYYVTYDYQKRDFGTAFYTQMSSIEAAYGALTPDNPLTLASWLAILNGAVIVGLKQVPKAEGSGQASLTSYREAIDELEGVLPGQINPDQITPMRGDSDQLYQYLALSNDKMSSIRYKSERTSIIGVSGARRPDEAGLLAQTLGRTRTRLVYPDVATLNITDALGVTTEYLVEGPYMAVALTGSVVSPNYDVATPWTGRQLTGFSGLARRLDPVQMNQLAQQGVTILEDRPPFLRVRHGFSTDMTNILTKTPTIILIADEIQRSSRSTLQRFIGIKFIPGVLGQIEGTLANMLKGFVQGQIIAAYTGVRATPDPSDPTVANVEAWYQPIFPLLYILMTFHLRASL
jgi:hypothetical protein